MHPYLKYKDIDFILGHSIKYNEICCYWRRRFYWVNLVDAVIQKGMKCMLLIILVSGKKENCNDKAIYHKLDISSVA